MNFPTRGCPGTYIDLSFQDWLYVTLGPDLGELAVFLLMLGGAAIVVTLVFGMMKLFDLM